MRVLERIANVAITVGVIVFIVVALRGDFALHRTALVSQPDLVGKPIALVGVDFPRDRKSIVIVMSTTCHFCQQSLPFYRELTEKSKGQLNVIAVLPQPPSEARTFLSNAGVKADQIVTASPDAVGVRGTPTVLLVNNNGVVERVWLGELDKARQDNLLAVSLPKSLS
jgi:hypothetical protein